MTHLRLGAWLMTLYCVACHGADDLQPQREHGSWLQAICRSPDAWPAPPGDGWRELSGEPVRFRGSEIGQRRQWRDPGGALLMVDRLRPGDRPGRWILQWMDEAERPRHFVGLDDRCRVRAVRRLVYGDRAGVVLQVMDDAYSLIVEEALDPDPPRSIEGAGPRGPAVAMVDAGVNYLLPDIRARMAVDADGRPAGFDFWDMDDRPFDAHFSASPFFVTRHGTRTASLLLAEAPDASLVSYRYPRPSMDRMADLVRHAAGLGIRIVGMPLGSNRPQDWQAFADAAREQPQMLFIASAGNQGRNIDREPVYPAALDLPNLLVVSSSGDDLRPARGSNYGARSVDYLLPAERIETVDFDGTVRRVSGSSYAVSRLAAMAARLLAEQPEMDTAELKTAISARTIPPIGDGDAGGVIPDPLADTASVDWTPEPAWQGPEAQGRGRDDVVFGPVNDGSPQGDDRIALRVLLLDPDLDTESVRHALMVAAGTLGQCDLGFRVTEMLTFRGSDYLRDLEVGAARTLMRDFPVPDGRAITLVFARDSRLSLVYDGQAFAIANTRARPWLRDSAWFLSGARDLPQVIAHELFHVLSNDAGHAPGEDNLMYPETGPGRTRLTPAQCALAQSFRHRGAS